MTEKQQEKQPVCQNNWFRRIAGDKRIDKARMEEMSEEVVKESLRRKLLRSKLMCAGHVERKKGNG